LSTPSYFAIIPANVRYDKDLKANAKLLYGEITALTNQQGYCWATNEYFANLYCVSKETVSRWISQLVKKGYLDLELSFNDKNETVRKIFLGRGCQNDHGGMTKRSRGGCQKDQGGHDKMIKHNNTINNTINNTTTTSEEEDENNFKIFHEKSKTPTITDEGLDNLNPKKGCSTNIANYSIEIEKIQSDIFGKIKVKVNKASIIKMLKEKGEELIYYYLKHWDKFASIKMKSVAGYFTSAVLGEYDFPTEQEGSSNIDAPSNMVNFEQREYTAADFEEYYYKVTD